MTTIQYHKDTDTFFIKNETHTANVPFNSFYSRITDCDLLDTARRAIDNAGDVVAVPSTSYARGLRPRAAQRHGVIM